jgi:hypothetical protein
MCWQEFLSFRTCLLLGDHRDGCLHHVMRLRIAPEIDEGSILTEEYPCTTNRLVDGMGRRVDVRRQVTRFLE